MVMTESEALIRSILGAVRSDIRPLACAVDVAREILFVKRIPMDEILVTKDIYPAAAKRLSKKPGAVTRSIERLANLCWDELADRKLMSRYIGERLSDIHAPRDVIIYLAFYLQFNRPFFEVVAEQPALLF